MADIAKTLDGLIKAAAAKGVADSDLVAAKELLDAFGEGPRRVSRVAATLALHSQQYFSTRKPAAGEDIVDLLAGLRACAENRGLDYAALDTKAADLFNSGG